MYCTCITKNMGVYFIAKAFILYSLCEFIVSKKIAYPDIDQPSSGKINECQRCKVLTDSFNHWLDKTSRGKFEGGDAAWEEAKLKSYARSEIRLVEVQEGLCSEVKKYQDQCYSLAEEAEQALEKWWFHEDPNSVDLHTWLCTETLQYCCPQNHFGESCSPCPLDKNNKVCGGNGKCDGEGTRKGDGTCQCRRGFSGKYCEECATNFYRTSDGLCGACHKACDGCSGDGAESCVACKRGWQLESNICVDVNECLRPTSCEPNQFCINKEGSHTCKACDISCKTCEGIGPSNCTSCEPSLLIWSGFCIDDKTKNELLMETCKRLALYSGLLLISLFISRTSRSLASLVVLVIAIFIYYNEKSSRNDILNVIQNMYLK